MENQLAVMPIIKNERMEVYDKSLNWLTKTIVLKAAGGFMFTEGAAWHPGGFFLFSDTPANKIYSMSTNGDTTVYLEKSGLTGNAGSELSDQLGSNGIAIDKHHNVIICQHGNHAVVRMNENKELSVVTDHYNGRPFNSPNDLIIRSDGTIFFTDPPYGLSGQVLHTDRFQPVAGIYQFSTNGIQLIDARLKYPNGLFFSADEKYLFVSSNHPEDPGIVRYKLTADEGARYDRIFIEQHADGMTTGPDGNIYLATDDGVLIISAEGKRLALLRLPEIASNLCWGGAQQEILMITARTSVYFITRQT